MRRILEGNKINGGELPFLSPTPRARSPFRAFLFRPGMAWARRMDESPNLAKMRNRGRGWVEYRRPGAESGDGWRCSKTSVNWDGQSMEILI
jgi:hypothetical protein